MTPFREAVNLIALQKNLPKKSTHLKEEAKVKFIKKCIEISQKDPCFGIINFEKSIYDGHQWDIVYAPIQKNKDSTTQNDVAFCEQVMSHWCFSNVAKNENVYFYRFLNLFRMLLGEKRWAVALDSLLSSKNELLAGNVRAYTGYRGKLDSIDKMILKKPKIHLSPLAAQYYRYQRCSVKKLQTHQEIEEFAYEFHYKIFEQIQKFISPGEKCLDIGCGIGVINIFTGRYFDEIYLLDGNTGVHDLEKTYYGYHGPGYANFRDDIKLEKPCEDTLGEYCFYNNLDVSRQVVEQNLRKKICTLTPDKLGELKSDSFHFVQSHMSWGWHYPWEMYREDVTRLLKKDGILILDIREGAISREALSDFIVLDKLKNREVNSEKYVLRKC